MYKKVFLQGGGFKTEGYLRELLKIMDKTDYNTKFYGSSMADGKDKAKALADYRRMMGLSYASLCELEIAYLEEDAEKVDAAMTKVKAGKKEGHKKYSDD